MFLNLIIMIYLMNIIIKFIFLVNFNKATNWRIGKQFFKKNTVIFKQDKNTISFYKNSKNNENFSLKLILL